MAASVAPRKNFKFFCYTCDKPFVSQVRPREKVCEMNLFTKDAQVSSMRGRIRWRTRGRDGGRKVTRVDCLTLILSHRPPSPPPPPETTRSHRTHVRRPCNITNNPHACIYFTLCTCRRLSTDQDLVIGTEIGRLPRKGRDITETN